MNALDGYWMLTTLVTFLCLVEFNPKGRDFSTVVMAALLSALALGWIIWPFVLGAWIKNHDDDIWKGGA